MFTRFQQRNENGIPPHSGAVETQEGQVGEEAYDLTTSGPGVFKIYHLICDFVFSYCFVGYHTRELRIDF